MPGLIAIALPTTTLHIVWVVAWLILIATSLACLLVLVVTKWGRSQPLRICVVLSLIAHLLLVGYAATIRIAGTPTGNSNTVIEVTFGEELVSPHQIDRQSQPWEKFPSQPLQPQDFEQLPPRVVETAGLPDDLSIDPLDNDEQIASAPPLTSVMPPVRMASARPAEPLNMPAPKETTGDKKPQLEIDAPKRVANDQSQEAIRQILTPPAPATDAAETPLPSIASINSHQPAPAAPLRSSAAFDIAAGDTQNSAEAEAETHARPPDLVSIRGGPTGATGSEPAQSSERQVPDIYRLRTAADRQQQAGHLGGTRETELAVEMGLKWLATAQSRQGHWEAKRWGGGRDRSVNDRHRQQAGGSADMGVTALALLAFLGRGHTHLEKGPYADTVRRGLEYLAKNQQPDGSLAGNATLFASMYCHGMASFAVSEAYALSGDKRLRPYVVRAINYTLAAQNSHTGGWRYRPGDAGDTSQLGWQVMALKSAELAGIPIPASAKRGVQRFLASVSSGRNGGLAGYRPGQAPSRTMTAEALVCRLFTGTPPDGSVATEAARYIIGRPPGSGRAAGQPMNFYNWYYSTLALYQRQDEMWKSWNESLQATLIATQNHSGANAGSWSPDTVWGNYGGRVYSTAMGTLCLEVYYRFLPLYGGGKRIEDGG